ncbi:hypothetical protein AVZ31_21660 [Mycolicibacterium neoaurum]|nr:hypothetical protein AVZ31_21660 [Mycolicibacterium neoaurum]
MLLFVIHQPNRGVRPSSGGALAIESDTLKLSSLASKLFTNKDFGGNELFSTPANELGMLSQRQCPRCCSIDEIGPVIDHGEVLSDSEVISFSISDSLQDTTARTLNVVGSTGGNVGGFSVQVTL